MDTLKLSDNVEQSLNDYDSGQDHRTTNHNSRKTSKEQEIYTRGSGRLRKSAEPEFASIMTSFDEPRITNENNDLNPEQKKTRKPDSPLYAVKGSTERDSSYRDRDNNRHGRGGRDHYSSNSQHRNLFTNNNRNKHKREFDNEKKTDPGTNVKPSVDDNSNPITNKGPPPVINHRSAILSQSTKSYERNVNNGPTPSVENGTVAAPTELGRDHGRNNYRNNRNNQFDNRRNNDNYDRGRGGRHYNRRDRDDRHHYDDHGAGGRYNRHGSNVDLTASTETLSHQSGRRYRGSQSDLARGQRDHWGQDNNNRGRNNRYRDSDRQNEAEDRRKDSESLQYNRPRHTLEQSATEDPYIGDTTSNVPNDTAPNIEYELSEQMGAVDLNETSQQRTPEEPDEGNNEQDTSDLVLIDPSQINSDYFSWSNVEDWSKGVDDDVWGSSVPSTSEQQELPRDPSPPLPPVDTSIPPPAPHTQDDKDWGSIRSKPQEDTSWRQSNNNNNSNNWSRDQRDNRSYSNEYNDRYGEPKKKPFNSNTSPSPGGRGFAGGRGGKGQFSGSYWDLPPRLRKQREEQHQQQQQRSNQQPPSPYPRGQGQPSPRDASYHSLGTHSDGNWKGESMEIRGNPHRHQDNRHYNSLPPPGRGRQDDGAPRGDFNRDRRFSTYDTDSTPRADYVHNSIDQTPPQSLPNPPALNNTDQTSGSNTTFSWVDDVEENEGKLEKLEKVKSAFQVPDPPAGGRGGGRGGFHGGRGGFNGGRGRDNRRDHHHEKLDSRSSSRSSRRRRKRSHLSNVNKSGSSVGSRRRSHSRDTVDTNISSTTTGTTRSRKNSDRSAASDKNWRDRAPQYEHSRSSEVTNWRDRGNSSSSSQDWKSLRSGGRAPNESLSWRQPPPQISEEPPARQDVNTN